MKLPSWGVTTLIALFIGAMIFRRVAYKDNPSPLPQPEHKTSVESIGVSKLPIGNYKVLEWVSREPELLTIKIESTIFPSTYVLKVMIDKNDSGEDFQVGSKFSKEPGGSLFGITK